MARPSITVSAADRVFYAANNAFLILTLIVVLYPLIYVLSSSFSSTDAVISGRVLAVAGGAVAARLRGGVHPPGDHARLLQLVLLHGGRHHRERGDDDPGRLPAVAARFQGAQRDHDVLRLHPDFPGWPDPDVHPDSQPGNGEHARGDDHPGGAERVERDHHPHLLPEHPRARAAGGGTHRRLQRLPVRVLRGAAPVGRHHRGQRPVLRAW